MTEPSRDEFDVRTHVHVLDCEGVPKAMRTECMSERYTFLRSFGQGVDPHPERRVRACVKELLAVLGVSGQRLHQVNYMFR